jgi:hypothetical protein
MPAKGSAGTGSITVCDTLFFHPDYTVGARIALALRDAGRPAIRSRTYGSSPITAGEESHLALNRH